MLRIKKIKGFALVQALFFMMFIMAIVSVSMMMSMQRTVTVSGERMAIDAYVAAYALIMNSGGADYFAQTDGTTYFSSYPLSSAYITQLGKECISDPSANCITPNDNVCSPNACAMSGPNLTLTIS